MKTLYSLHSVAQSLEAGNLIVYPTESVYGMGCLPHHLSTLRQLRDIKQRPLGQAWILIGSALEHFAPYVDLNALHGVQSLLLDSRSLYHPMTWVVPASPFLNAELKDNRQGLAIRLTLFKPLVRLCHLLQQPIISTSANFRGQKSCQDRAAVRSFLNHLPSVIFWDRPLGPAQQPSQIKELFSGKLLR